MARLFTDGAEMGDALSLPHVNLDRIIAVSDVKRSGGYSYRSTGYGDETYFQVSVPDISEVYVRYGHLMNMFSNYGYFKIQFLQDTTVLGSFEVGTDSQTYYRAKVSSSYVETASSAISATNWNLVEIRFKLDDSGIMQMLLDGRMVIDYSGDTKPDANATFNAIRFIPAYGSLYNQKNNIDDIAINDTSGATDNGWCGDGHIIALTPNANGDSSDLVGSDSDSTDNYLLVDEVPSDDDTTYVESSTPDDYDLYNLTACGLGASAAIGRVWAEARAKDTTTGDGTVNLVVKTESTEYDSDDIDLSTSYASQKGTTHVVNPNTSSAWTPTQLDALQVGMKVVD